MTRRVLTIVGIALLSMHHAQARAQERGSPPKDFAKLGAPGPEHKHLDRLVGTWILSIEGSEKKGKARFKSIWDGRFVTEEVTLPFGGIDLEWYGIYGYDRHKRKYTAVWVDNMDTNTESGEGDIDPGGNVLTWKGQHEDPRSGRLATFLWRISLIDRASLRIQMFDLGEGGKETKILDIRGQRSK
jgi:hypothetical protein